MFFNDPQESIFFLRLVFFHYPKKGSSNFLPRRLQKQVKNGGGELGVQYSCLSFELIISFASSLPLTAFSVDCCSKFWSMLWFYSAYWLIPHPNDFCRHPGCSFLHTAKYIPEQFAYIPRPYHCHFLFTSLCLRGYTYFYSLTDILTGLQGVQKRILKSIYLI